MRPTAKIMIVEDDLDLLEELDQALSFNNYDVEIVPNSALAFAMAAETKPDLIITDLKMKPKSGFEVAEELKNSFHTRRIPIIAITGFYTQEEHQRMIKMFGIKHVVLKPFNAQVLMEKITHILGIQKD